MKGWPLRRIDELGKVVTGKTPSCNNPDEFGSEYPFITPSDIPNTQKYVTVERYLSEKGMERHRRIKLPHKTTCVVCIGATIGKTCMTHGVSFSNQQINSIITNKDNNSDFAYYLATTLKDSLVAFAGGSATPILNKSAFSSIKVFVPKKRIQQKTAAVLSTYDDLIENNNRRIAILEKMAEERYREWFVRLRFPGHEKTKIVKGVPEGWKVKTSLDLFDVLGGGTPKTENSAFWDGDIPFFTPKDAHAGYFANVTEKSITKTGLESCNSKLYEKNTIFITARGTVGEIVLAMRPMAMNQSCYALVPKNGKHVHFYFLAMKNAVNIIKGTANSGVFDNIITDSFKQIQLFQPNETILDSFDEKVVPVINQIEKQVRKNSNLMTSRDRLLTRLMSGKIDVEDLDIQFPASMKEEEAIAHV